MDYAALPREFYFPSAARVAPRLLGHLLIRKTPAGVAGGYIVETEAYVADDPACHAFPGLTPRNRVMFGPPGHSYVYFIYGCYYCVNAVCRPEGAAEAVLIRALEPACGEEFMTSNREVKKRHSLADGPGKLCAALDITRAQNGADLCDTSAEIFIAANPHWRKYRRENGPVAATSRIGITQAADWPLRFHLGKNLFVSRTPHARRKLASANS